MFFLIEPLEDLKCGLILFTFVVGLLIIPPSSYVSYLSILQHSEILAWAYLKVWDYVSIGFLHCLVTLFFLGGFWPWLIWIMLYLEDVFVDLTFQFYWLTIVIVIYIHPDIKLLFRITNIVVQCWYLQTFVGCTPLHWAVLRGNAEACTLLVHAGTKEELTVKDNAGLTPAELASDKGHRQIAVILVGNSFYLNYLLFVVSVSEQFVRFSTWKF